MEQEVNPEVCDEVLYLTYKARIYPNSTQEKAITANIENNRYVFNLMVTYCRLHLEGYGKLPSLNDLVRFGTLIWKRCPFFHDMYQNSMNDTAKRVLISYKRCLEKAHAIAGDGSVTKGHGRPRYRKAGNCSSYGYPQVWDSRYTRMEGSTTSVSGRSRQGRG